MPVPSMKVFPEGNNSGHGSGLTAGFSGFRDRHYKISVVVRGWFYERGAFQALPATQSGRNAEVNHENSALFPKSTL